MSVFGRPAVYSFAIGIGVILVTWVGADVPFNAVNVTASLMGLLFWSGVVRSIMGGAEKIVRSYSVHSTMMRAAFTMPEHNVAHLP